MMYFASVIIVYLLGSSAAHLSFYLNETETTRLLGMPSLIIKVITALVLHVSIIVLCFCRQIDSVMFQS